MEKEEDASIRIEQLLPTLRFAIRDDLDAAKHEIIEPLREVETALKIIAREMARRNRE